MKNNEEVLNIIFKVSDSIQYEINEFGRVVILEKQDHFIQRVLRKMKVNIPMYKKTTLDEYSSEVFLDIDGEKSVKEIGEILDYKYGMQIHPLYERLLLFLNHINVNLHYIEKV